MEGIEMKELEALISKAVEGRLKGDDVMSQAKAMVEAAEAKSAEAIEALKKELDTHADKHRTELKRLMAYRQNDGFDQAHSRRRIFPSSRMSADMGYWYLAAVEEDERAIKVCEERGIELKAMTEGGTPGAIVPIQFVNQIQIFQETHGVIRANANIMPITEGGISYPKLTNEFKVYHPSEGNAPTASDLDMGLNTLKPKDYAVLTKVSRNLSDDAAIALGELLARQMVFAFSKQEDKNGFQGDGTSSSARTTGIIPSLVGLAGEIAAGTGENTFAKIKFGSLKKLVASLPEYALDNAKFYGHSSVLWLMQGIEDTNGRPIATDTLIDGSPGFRLFGYPYVSTQVLPSSTAANQADTSFLVFGNLEQTVDLGDRQVVTIEHSDHAEFASRMRVYLGVERIDIQMNNIGDANGIGSVAVLKTAA